MHIAIGYRYYETAAGYHIERALRGLGHTVTYIGLPASDRSGFESTVPVSDIIAKLPQLPDLYLWMDPMGRYFPAGIAELPVPTACYLIDVHLGHWRKKVASFFDAVFIAQKGYLDQYRQVLGHRQVYWLPLAAAPDVHYRHDLPRIYDVGFVGNISLAHKGTARARRLKLLEKRFRTADFYRQYTPEEVGRVYSQSKIVVNTSIAGDVPMRIFEGTASGALVLTDSAANGLEELFDIGTELVIYSGDADLIEQVEYYLDHEEERDEIASGGYCRTHAEHTYAHRAQEVIDVINDPAFQQHAPMRTATREERLEARTTIYTHLHMLDALLDMARDVGYGPVRRTWVTLPCLIRRLLI